MMIASRPLRLVALILGTLVETTSAGHKLFTQSKFVADLDPDNITDLWHGHIPWVMMYYADWCPHCHHYAPVFEEIAQGLADISDKVKFGAINCPDYNTFCNSVQIHGYPTLRTYHFPEGATDVEVLKGGNVDKSIAQGAKGVFQKWIRSTLPGSVLPVKPLSKDWFKEKRSLESAGKAASVKVMLTADERRRLIEELGYSQIEAEQMRLELATTVLEKGIKRPWGEKSMPGSWKAPQKEAPPLAAATQAAADKMMEGVAKSVGMGIKYTASQDGHGKGDPQLEFAPELHIIDAEVAVLYTLRQTTFLHSGEVGGKIVISGEQLSELLAWLDFLARALPGKVGPRELSSLAQAVREAVAASPSGTELLKPVWAKLLDGRGLDRAPPEAGLKPDAFWRRCSTYTCGLWTLFHTLSQSVPATDDGSHGFLSLTGAARSGPE
ncbi:unnamed protein product, partial [Polarella glacialis]